MVDMKKIADITKDEDYLELLKEYGSKESMKNVLKELIDFSASATQTLTDSAIALTVAKKLCKVIDKLLYIILTAKDEENADDMDLLLYQTQESVDIFMNLVSKLDLPEDSEVIEALEAFGDDDNGVLRFG